MLVDKQISDFYGLPVGPSPAASVEKVVNFIEKQLVIFSHQYAGSRVKNEKGLTQELCMVIG